MKRIAPLWVITMFGSMMLTACGGTEAVIRSAVEEAEKATELAWNYRDFSKVEPFFATPAEGAVAAGLNETRDALKQFISQLTGSDQVQVHTFRIQKVAVHESAGQATVTYRLYFSVVRSGAAMYSAIVTQDLAVINTPRGWRIGGGDAPQLSNVIGAWP